jgi:hypothetical protein
LVISFGLGLPAVPVAAAVVTLLAIATAVWGATRDRSGR